MIVWASICELQKRYPSPHAHTEYGGLQIDISRDQNEDFKQQTVALYEQSNDTLETFVIHMFQKGMTMSEISNLIEGMYGHHHTPQTISNMTQTVTEAVDAFRQHSLSERYVYVYLDATFLPVKRETVSKEAVYIVVGIGEDGSKEVLAYTIAPTESSYVCEDIQARGVAEALPFISDGLTGIKDSIHSVLSKAKYQSCFIHIARNIAHKIRVSDLKVICEDLKCLYRTMDKAEAEQGLDAFTEKERMSYAKFTQSLKANPDLFTFHDFPQIIRRSIFSTNLIESFSKSKEQFLNEASLNRFLVTLFEAYNQWFATRCHIGFDQAVKN